jgi:hypothetical protein
MWSSWVKEKGTTQVIYIAKLKDGPNRVRKTFSMILERVFEMVWWRGRKWNHIKKDFWCWSVFSSQNIDFPFIWRDSWSLFFSLLCLLRTRGFWWYLRRKSILQTFLLKWLDMEWRDHDCGYTGSGCIFWDGVMHVNIAKPWLWTCGSCGYISGGRIF